MKLRRVAALTMLLVLPSSCLGENEPVPDFETQLATYDDKGRTAVDPLTPGTITITLDDGPSEYTREIIDILTRHRVQATFFWVGRLVAGRRDVVEHARASGQQVASHSYNHEAQPSLSEEQFKHRVRAVKDNLGDSDNGRLYFRFPFGAANDEQLRWLREVDIGGKFYKAVGWHCDSQDFDFNTGYPAAPFSKNILDDDALPDGGVCNGQANPFQRDFVGWTVFTAHQTKGGIILFHDTKLITRDKLDEILDAFESPERYWAELIPEKRTEYSAYYDCHKVDRLLRFKYRPLHDGLYPSFRD